MRRSVIVLISIGILLTACSSSELVYADLIITGDIEEHVMMNEIINDLNTIEIAYNGENIVAVEITELLNSVSLVYEDFDIYLKANDGYMVKLDGDSLVDTYIGYSAYNRWVYVSDKHPVNSRIKNIVEVIIVEDSDEVNYNFGLNIVIEDKTLNYSLGQLLVNDYQVTAVLDGTTTMTYNGQVYSVDVMKQKKVVDLNNLVNTPIESVLIMDEKGLYEYRYGEAALVEIGNGCVNYYSLDSGKCFHDIIGLIINPPLTTVMDAYNDALHYLQQDEDVMIIFVDGFSYLQYQYLAQHKPQMFISSLENVQRANTVYKPVTNAGFASMITGQPPSITGVLNRDYRQINTDTIFDKASEIDKKSILIEGDINILNTSIAPSLNFDKNNNGIKDDEIFENALAEIDKNYNLFFVHFHSVDEFGHAYGDINEKVMEHMQLIDNYLAELVGKWAGKVIILADHGMHSTVEGGSHGEFRAEDLLIPYVVLEGGKY